MFLPGESHGQRSLADCSTESDIPEHTHTLVLALVFWGSVTLFSVVITLIYIPIDSTWGFCECAVLPHSCLDGLCEQPALALFLDSLRKGVNWFCTVLASGRPWCQKDGFKQIIARNQFLLSAHKGGTAACVTLCISPSWLLCQGWKATFRLKTRYVL